MTILKPTKAIIAAAGRGTRFLPISKAYPKELMNIIDKPIIQYHIEELIKAGIKEICIVCRKNENQIEKYFSKNKELDGYLFKTDKLELLESINEINSKIKLVFIEQDLSLPYGNASPILAAKKFISKDDFIYFFGDDLTIETEMGTFLKKMINTFIKENADGILMTTRIDKKDISKYGTISFKENKKGKEFKIVKEILEKNINSSSNYIQLYKFIFKNKVLKNLLSQKPSKNNELWLSDLNNTIAKQGKLIAIPLDKKTIWTPAGDPINWLETNILMALKSTKYKKEIKKFLSQF